MVCAYNVTRRWRRLERATIAAAGVHAPYDTLENRTLDDAFDDTGALWLSPYSACWIVDRPRASPGPVGPT